MSGKPVYNSLDADIFRNYNKCTKITYDPAKDKSNRVRLGISLADTIYLDWGELLVKPKTRKDYGELREVA